MKNINHFTAMAKISTGIIVFTIENIVNSLIKFMGVVLEIFFICSNICVLLTKQKAIETCNLVQTLLMSIS